MNLGKLEWLSVILYLFCCFFFLQSNMPLRALYAMVLEHDIKVGNSASETVGLLQQKEFYQVLDFCGEQITSLENQAVVAAGVLPKPNSSCGWGKERWKCTPGLREKEAPCKACFLCHALICQIFFSHLLRNLPS